MKRNKMLNAQVSIFNEWTNSKCTNALNHCYIGNSLSIEHCQLIIKSTIGDAL